MQISRDRITTIQIVQLFSKNIRDTNIRTLKLHYHVFFTRFIVSHYEILLCLLCRFLALSDIALLVYTLECLYALTSLGERPCTSVARVRGAIDTLVALVTVEAQSYGPKACILMRVVETVSTVAAQQNTAGQGAVTSAPATPAATTTTAASTASSSPATVTATPTGPASPASSRPTTPAATSTKSTTHST